MKRFQRPFSSLLCLLAILVTLAIGVNHFSGTAHASTVFPGIYPSLTQSGAESYQQQVNQGQQAWLLDPAQTSLHLAEQLLSWPSNSTTTVQSGGGTHDSSATVLVGNKAPDRGSITVTLARLDGNTNGGIWIVTATTSAGFSITSPTAYSTVAKQSSSLSPSTVVSGVGKSFEGVVGQVSLFDSSYTSIASATAHADTQGSYSTLLTYSTTSTGDALIALYPHGSVDGGIDGAVLIKVTIA